MVFKLLISITAFFSWLFCLPKTVVSDSLMASMALSVKLHSLFLLSICLVCLFSHSISCIFSLLLPSIRLIKCPLFSFIFYICLEVVFSISVLTLTFLTNVLHDKINCPLLCSWAKWDLRELSCHSSHLLSIVQQHFKTFQTAIDILSLFSMASAYFLPSYVGRFLCPPLVLTPAVSRLSSEWSMVPDSQSLQIGSIRIVWKLVKKCKSGSPKPGLLKISNVGGGPSSLFGHTLLGVVIPPGAALSESGKLFSLREKAFLTSPLNDSSALKPWLTVIFLILWRSCFLSSGLHNCWEACCWLAFFWWVNLLSGSFEFSLWRWCCIILLSWT